MSSIGAPDTVCVSVAEEHAAAFSSWYRAKETENARYKIEARSRRTQRESPLIVIIDDEPVVAITMTEVLRRHGANVVWFTEPLLALAYVESGPVDLVVSDTMMPLMDGVLLSTQVQAIQPSCAIFLLSAINNQVDVIEQIAVMELDVHVESKPLQMTCLLTAINRLLTEWMR